MDLRVHFVHLLRGPAQFETRSHDARLLALSYMPTSLVKVHVCCTSTEVLRLEVTVRTSTLAAKTQWRLRRA